MREHFQESMYITWIGKVRSKPEERLKNNHDHNYFYYFNNLESLSIIMFPRSCFFP